MDIRITGAAQNTLRNIDLVLPAGKITVLVGPSGSGKSTLAYDTLFAESRRRFLDCLSPGARRLLARPDKPKVQSIEGLPPALCLEQHLPPGQTRALLGTITEVADYLRILYAAVGTPHDPDTGEELTRLSHDEITARLCDLPEGTRLTLLAPLPPGWGTEAASDLLQLRKLGYLRVRVNGTLQELDELEQQPPNGNERCEVVVDRIVVRPSSTGRIADSTQAGLRLCPDELRAVIQQPGGQPEERSYHTRYRNEHTGFEIPDLSPGLFSHYSPQGACPECKGLGSIEGPKGSFSLCPACGGLRLNRTALAVTLSFAGREMNPGQLCELPVDDLLALPLPDGVPPTLAQALEPVHAALRARLLCLQQLGLGYLHPGRAANTLSGGELQRARLAGQIGGGLSGVLYILDEPTIGLHPRETERLIEALRRLRDRGNTLLVVEHDPLVIQAADHVVEMGPGAGTEGGLVLAEGSYDEIRRNPASPTGAWLRGERNYCRENGPAPAACPCIRLRHARANNLQDVDFRLPLGTFTCLTGPGGSGKSTLVHRCLLPALREGGLEGAEGISRAVVVDQAPLGSSARSTPATATGLLDVLRPLYASLPLSRQRGYKATRFSLNTRGGRCERCGGTGLLEVDMNFLADLYTPCDACHGARYNRETLEVTWRGKSIAAALAQTVDEALGFFAPIPAAVGILQAMHDLGLGYLPLDRSVTTLSGGEAQRIKLATQLAKAAPKRGSKPGEKLLIVLDEPTNGLHFGEVDRLLRAIYRLRSAGHTILCIEHHEGLISRADYLVELGPGAGKNGGRIVYEGPPCPEAPILHAVNAHLS